MAATGLGAPSAEAVEGASEQTLPPVEVVTPKEGTPPAKPAKPAKAANADPTVPPDGKGSGKAGSGQTIAVLVNDDPITAYEIEQRRSAALMGSSEVAAYVKKNATPRWQQMIKSAKLNEEFKAFAEKRGVRSKEEALGVQKAFLQQKQKALIEELQREARASLKKGGKDEAVEALIDERLKLQEAKRLNVVVPDEEVDKVLGGMAERNKLTIEQFAAQLKQRGMDLSTMRARFKADLSWRDVIRRRFGTQVAVAERDIDRLVAKAPAGADEVALEVQRITLALTIDADQKAIAARMQEAETLRGKFTGCKSAAELAKSAGAKFENLGARKPSSIGEPTRSLLLAAQGEDILPPAIDAGGIDLWVVCGRQAAKATDEQRAAAQDQLRQREFDLLAKRHLKDLRQDAHIEYR